MVLPVPMNALVFHLIRMPLMPPAWGRQTEVYHALSLLHAPITEEPANPADPGYCYLRLKSLPVHRSALAIGLASSRRGRSPRLEIAKYPWYMLNGYIGERVMVHHARSVHRGGVGALVKHRSLAVCLPAWPALAGKSRPFSPAKRTRRPRTGNRPATVGAALRPWGCLPSPTAKDVPKLIRGKVRCPECNSTPTNFGLGPSPQARACPHCRHWHLVNFAEETSKPVLLILPTSSAGWTGLADSPLFISRKIDIAQRIRSHLASLTKPTRVSSFQSLSRIQPLKTLVCHRAVTCTWSPAHRD